MPTETDDDLRELFAPLAADEPSVTELRALRRRVGSRRARSPRRVIAGVAALTAALATGLAVLPGAPPSDETTTGDSVLRAAAAAAADQPVPRVAGAPLRYAKVKSTLSYVARRDDRMAEHHVEQIRETWVGRSGRAGAPGPDASGTPATPRSRMRCSTGPAASRTHGTSRSPTGTDRWPSSTRPRSPKVATRSSQPARGIRLDRWGPYAESRGREHLPAGPVRDGYTTYAFIGLLVNAWLTPAQRRAARRPGHRPRGPRPGHRDRSRRSLRERGRAGVPRSALHHRLRSRQLRDPRVDDVAVLAAPVGCARPVEVQRLPEAGGNRSGDGLRDRVP